MTHRRILVAVLDWGLGHATRSIPLIQELIRMNCEVLLAGAGASLELLRLEFPGLKSVDLPAYDPKYSSSDSQMAKLTAQAFHFAHIIKQEHNVVQDLIREHNINAILSDNRYGCYSEIIPCVLITHQLNLLPAPGWKWLGNLVNAVTLQCRKRFSKTWVPDYPGSILTGVLSNTNDDQVNFIGPLSRFQTEADHHPVYQRDILALISGPEPQRTVLEEKVIQQAVGSGLRILIVRGIIGQQRERISDRVEICDHLKMNELKDEILKSELVLCRSGYSTLMDLIALKKKAILIPTPGQTEQEYLADRFMHLGVSYSVDQNRFDLSKAWKECHTCTGFGVYELHHEGMRMALLKLLGSIQ
jgi:uncharacterized protein (TIGR00661 family)